MIPVFGYVPKLKGVDVQGAYLNSRGVAVQSAYLNSEEWLSRVPTWTRRSGCRGCLPELGGVAVEGAYLNSEEWLSRVPTWTRRSGCPGCLPELGGVAVQGAYLNSEEWRSRVPTWTRRSGCPGCLPELGGVVVQGTQLVQLLIYHRLYMLRHHQLLTGPYSGFNICVTWKYNIYNLLLPTHSISSKIYILNSIIAYKCKTGLNSKLELIKYVIWHEEVYMKQGAMMSTSEQNTIKGTIQNCTLLSDGSCKVHFSVLQRNMPISLCRCSLQYFPLQTLHLQNQLPMVSPWAWRGTSPRWRPCRPSQCPAPSW